MTNTIDEEQKSFVVRKISNIGKDELGIRPNKSFKYYDKMFAILEAEADKYRNSDRPVPKLLLKRIDRVKDYRKNAPSH